MMTTAMMLLGMTVSGDDAADQDEAGDDQTVCCYCC